jgi:hypothetical protein
MYACLPVCLPARRLSADFTKTGSRQIPTTPSADWQDAVAVYRAVRKTPFCGAVFNVKTSSFYQDRLGTSGGREGSTQKKKPSFCTQGLELAPRHAATRVALADTLSNLKRYAEAVRQIAVFLGAVFWSRFKC